MAGKRVTQTVNVISTEVIELVYHCIADAGDASVLDTEMSKAIYTQLSGWSLDSVKTVPGGTGPTDDTDLVIHDQDDLDILGGNGANMIDNATVNATVPSVDGQNKRIPITGKLTTVVTNNAVNSAIFDIKMIFVRAV